MSVKIQKINLDVTIINFDRDMTPEDFAKELSNVTGREIWRYEKDVYFNGSKTSYKFFSGLGTNEEIYTVYEYGSVIIDNNSKKAIGTNYTPITGGATQIGDSHKNYGIGIGLILVDNEKDEITDELPDDKNLIISSKE